MTSTEIRAWIYQLFMTASRCKSQGALRHDNLPASGGS